MRRFLIALAFALAPSLAWAQGAIVQGGPWVAGHAPMYVGAGSGQAVVQDGGGAGGGGPGVGLSELLITARGTGTAPYSGQGTGPLGSNACDYDAPTSNAGGYHYLCWSANLSGGNGGFVFGAAGGASTTSLVFNVNGVNYSFPFTTNGALGPATSVVNDAACWNNTTGTLLKDCGAFVTVGGTNTWTGTNNFTGTFQISSITQTFPASGNLVGTSDSQTLTNKSISAGQINSGTLAGAQAFALTGDVTSSAGSAVTTIAANAVTNAKLATATQNTVKGAATSTAEADLTMASCSAAGNALQWLTNTGFQCGTLTNQTAGWGLTGSSTFSISTAAPPFGFDMPVNLGLSASAAASALTINLTTQAGATPSATNPVLIPFRSTTLATGTVVWTAVTGALSIVINSGATLGTSNSNVPFRVWIFAEYNSGTPELAVATCSLVSTAVMYACQSWETNRVTSTTITGLATAAGTLYATTGVASDAVRIIGYCDFASGLATAGAWVSACTTLQAFGPGVPRPGAVVQGPLVATSSTTAQSTGTTKVQATPTQAITPSATMNLIHVHVDGSFGVVTNVGNGGCEAILSRGTSYTAVTTGNTAAHSVASNSTVAPVGLTALDAPAVVSATTYAPFVFAGATVTCQWNYAPNNVAPVSIIEVYEIMGALDEPANDNVNPGVYAMTG